ncbi:MAG TPA: DnaJ C-terminal domain-containing protein, partial [Chloroflexota bacterium]
VLSDKEKRAKYDRWGPDWQQREQAEQAARQAGFDPSTFQQGTGGFGGFDFGGGRSAGGGGLDDLLEQILGGGARGRAGWRARSQAPMRGEDMEHPVQVTLAEAYTGTSRLLQIGGPEQRRLEVKIPAGVRDGSRIRMSGEGSAGLGGGPKGDLYLVVSVAPDPRFERKEDDLYVEVPAPLSSLILGGEAHVPTPTGKKLALTLPPETQNGKQFRLGGQGMPHLQGSGKGDLFAKVKAILPTDLSPREKELFEELAKLRK